jgi:DNA invertase Pin-like site-specific DNA recombinase
LGQGAEIDTATAAGRMIFGIFASLAEYERELIRERIQAGLKAARSRGRRGGRKPALTKAKIRVAQHAMKNRDTVVSELCRELKISPMTLYRYVSPKGELRAAAVKVLSS